MKNKSNFKSDNILFFLFTCVKDGRQFIEKLFDSLICQTKKNFVHYIYEDGSSDDVSDLVDKYKKNVSMLEKPYEIIYENNKVNIGLNMSTMHCIEKCNKKYFIWIDCDNWVDKDFFMNLEKTARKHPDAIMIKSTLFTVLENGDVFTDINTYRKRRENNKKNQIKNFFMNCYPFGFSFFAIKKAYLPDNFSMLNERHFSNDHQVICQVLFEEHPIVWSKKSIGYFLSRSNSEGHTNLRVTKGTDLNRQWYLELLAKTSNDSIDLLHNIYRSLDLYKKTIEYIDTKQYSLAIKTMKEKRKLNRKCKLNKRYYCKYHNDLYWFIKIIVFSFLRR